MRIWLTRTLSGWATGDTDSQRVLGKFPMGTTLEFDVKTRHARSGQWHRRYWLLMGRLAEAVPEVNIRELGDDGEPIMYPVQCADDVHTALKFITGLCHKHTLESGGQTHLLRIPKSTAFDKLTPDEWATYWPRVLDAVHQRILPGVSQYIEDDLAKLAS